MAYTPPGRIRDRLRRLSALPAPLPLPELERVVLEAVARHADALEAAAMPALAELAVLARRYRDLVDKL